jgi:hypothetical protein
MGRILLLLLFNSIAIAIIPMNIDAEYYYQSIIDGKAALGGNNPDSAITCFLTAGTEGFPRDSLYYYLAEAYLLKTVLDTALALNYSIKPAEKVGFRNDVFRQRARIFACLGMETYAKAALDSLSGETRKRRQVWAPYLAMTAGLGYSQESRTPQTEYPWDTIAQNDTAISSPDGNLGMELGWSFPLPRKMDMGIGLKGRVSRPFNASTAPVHSDSLDISAGAFCEFNAGQFSARAEWLGGRTYLDDLISTSRLDAGWSAIMPQAVLSSMLEYMYTGATDPGNQSHNGLFLLFIERTAGPKFGGMVLVNAHYTAATEYPETPVHVIDLEKSLDTLSTLIYIKPAVDTIGTLANSTRIINSVVTAAPSISFRFEPAQTTGITLRAGWNLSYFPEKYRWHALNRPEHDTGAGLSYVALNPADGQYYWISKLKNAPLGQDPYQSLSEGLVDYRTFEAWRIDNAVSLVVTFEKKFRQAGTISISFDAARNWSTLAEFAPPVDIPQWTLRLGLAWKTVLGRYR